MAGKFPSDEQLKKKAGWKEKPIGGAITRTASALQNKTGSWRAFRPVVDQSKCIKCELCSVYCPDNSIHNEGGKRAVNLDYCKGCGICSKVCPVKAITMKEESVFRD